LEEGFERERERDDSLPPPFISLPPSSPPSSVAGQGRGFDIDLVNKVYILTQFNSASLNRHIARAYNSGTGVTFGDGYVEVYLMDFVLKNYTCNYSRLRMLVFIISGSCCHSNSREAGKKWFRGTVDAVRQFHWLFEDPRSKDIEDVLILFGDHLYRMDYMDFVQ
ncbi:hypothetical protein S83_043633, partial [Arachis hypogaea]